MLTGQRAMEVGCGNRKFDETAGVHWKVGHHAWDRVVVGGVGRGELVLAACNAEGSKAKPMPNGVANFFGKNQFRSIYMR